MYYKTLSVLLLSATALAAPQEDNNYSSVLNDLDSLVSQSEVLNFLTASSIPSQVVSAAGIPPSVVQALQTGIPTSFAQEIFTNSEARSSLAKDIQSSNYPDWYTSLPSGVQSYISAQETASPAEATSTPTSTDSDSDSTDSPSAGAESSTSDSGAPAQTGAMAAGLAGAAGVLGLAFAL